RRLELLAIDDGDVPALVLDQPLLAKKGRHLADRLPAYPQHLREDRLRQRELLGARPILHEQQPPTRALLDRVKRVARGSLMREPHRVLAVPLHQLLKGATPLYAIEEDGR